MEALQPCPNCLNDVDIIKVNHNNTVEQKYYFFVHCKQCGKGTTCACPSENILAVMWNECVLEKESLLG